MDTSEQFIKMSDCPEIFNECKFQGGDWFHVDGKSWMVNEFNEELSLEEHRKHFEGIVFLPRQDDIQKMMPKNKCKCPCCLIIHLYKFLEKNIEQLADVNVDSMEQLWLAFYFH